MKFFEKVFDLQAFLNAKGANSTIGFVPTMGALHNGHISLLKKALAENDLVVLSIFVNPTQFNNPEDLKNYPRTIKEDVKLLQQHVDVIIFAPSVEEVYPEGFGNQPDFDFSPLDKVMEGAFRPGHFNGVGRVVKRFFEIVNPQRAYFGQKDFQQLAIIKNMAAQLNLPLEIISCPTERETDGLAMSSRNRNLTPEARKFAAAIPVVLNEAKSMQPLKTVQQVKEWATGQIEATGFLQLDYFEIADVKNLQHLQNWNPEGNNVACIAVFAGKVRLIDNIVF
ncbi:MAG: pantoate--beta-alanine ligase [Bacteroidetes bacterium]|nr:pantoate--beta-alanine ligase [Bacteroidota bacterium]